MKKKMSMEQRAWNHFKGITFVASLISFGCGALTILFIRDNTPIMLLILVAPISYAIALRVFAKDFLKEGIKPYNE